MVSQPKGVLYVPVWVDSGVVKALVTDAGYIPVLEQSPITELDVTLKASDITLPVSEQSPLTNIQARLYTYVNGAWVAAPTETAGPLHVHLESYKGTILIQQYMPSLLQPGMNTYIAGSWQKQGMIWSYHDRHLEVKQDNSDVAAAFYHDMPAVPAGYVWQITGVSVYRATNSAEWARLQIYDGSAAVSIEDIDMPLAGSIYPNTQPLTLRADDRIRVGYINATIGETVITTAWGYQMKVDL